MTDRGPPEVTSVRGSRSRPGSYDTAVSFVKVPGNHGDISPYLSGAGFAPRPRPRCRFGEPWHCDEITLGDKPRQTSLDRPGCLMQPVLGRHDRVSEHWARLGIVPLKIDHRTCGRSATFAVFLDMRGFGDLQGRVGCEGSQCREFGTARAPNPPGRLEHA